MRFRRESIYINQEDTLDIHVIGYANEGESIVINLANKFVGVIDCYKTNQFFLTKNFLESFEIETLDFLCWTHTDYDHTKGLSELFGYVGDKTKFIVPDGISNKELLTELSPTDLKKEEYKKIFSFLNSGIAEKNFCSVNEYSMIPFFRLIERAEQRYFSIQIECFAPLAKITKMHSIRSIKRAFNHPSVSPEKPNDFSVGFKFLILEEDIPVVSLCFTGDLDNYTIRRLDQDAMEDIFNYNHVLKIPHHGSSNSNRILHSGCITDLEHAVSTSYAASHLPKKDVLTGYGATGAIVSTTCQKEGEYGIVTYRIPITSHRRPIQLEYEGAAGQFIHSP